MKILILLSALSLYGSAHNITHQLQLSRDERKVTIHMMQDRLKALERRVESINECKSDHLMDSESVLDEIENLKHDKRSLLFVIKTMKEE